MVSPVADVPCNYALMLFIANVPFKGGFLAKIFVFLIHLIILCLLCLHQFLNLPVWSNFYGLSCLSCGVTSTKLEGHVV